MRWDSFWTVSGQAQRLFKGKDEAEEELLLTWKVMKASLDNSAVHVPTGKGGICCWWQIVLQEESCQTQSASEIPWRQYQSQTATSKKLSRCRVWKLHHILCSLGRQTPSFALAPSCVFHCCLSPFLPHPEKLGGKQLTDLVCPAPGSRPSCVRSLFNNKVLLIVK